MQEYATQFTEMCHAKVLAPSKKSTLKQIKYINKTDDIKKKV